ncbi:MAG: AraC family transcriptional regulator [Pseudomonadota bacterium]
MSNALAVLHGAFGRAALYNLDRAITIHAHREGHLIFWIDGSAASVSVNDCPVNVDAGSAAAVSPWEPHDFSFCGSDAGLFLVLYLKPVWFLEASRNASFALSFGRPMIELSGSVQAWIAKLTALLLAGEPSERFDGYLFELTRECHDQSWQWAPDSAPLRIAANTYKDYRIRKAITVMNDRFREMTDMDDLARDAGLSRPHFFKLFKKQMGITPNLYLNTLRSEAAIGNLIHTNKTVTDISHELGFASQASFTRFFTCNVGIPPSDYRRVAQSALI